MSPSLHPVAPADRLIGQLEGAQPGPTVILLGGVHGNEPAGVQALAQVLAELQQAAPPLRGRLVALRGNVAALRRGQRFVDEDLNRLWRPERVAAVRAAPAQALASSEQREMKQLLAAIDPLLAARGPGRPPVVLGDLHSFSAPGRMFAIADRSLRNANLFGGLDIPLIVGMEAKLQGAAFHYYEEWVDSAFVVEGGQHEDAATVARLAEVVRALLHEVGCLPPAGDVAPAPLHVRQPLRVRPVYRHPVAPEDRFVMRPGFLNLQKVRQGQWLASDRHGRILAPNDGYLLMPLYQAQGSDGFFIAQEAAAA